MCTIQFCDVKNGVLRVVSPEISSGKFPEIYSYFSGKLPERFYRELFTATNLPNNFTFAYNDAFERLLQ